MPRCGTGAVLPEQVLRLTVLWGEKVLDVCTFPASGEPARAAPGSLADLALRARAEDDATLQPGDQGLSWRLGLAEARLAWAHPATGVRTPFAARLDTTFLNLLLLALFSAGALLATFHLRPARLAQSEEELHKVPARAVEFLVTHVPRAEPIAPLRDSLDEPGQLATAPRTRGAEGQAGRPDRPRTAHRTAIRRTAPDAKESILGQGALLPFGAGDAPQLAGILGGPSVGQDLVDALGDIHSPTPGESGGLLGGGLRGTGPGGGGRDELIRLGRLPTSGTFSGDRRYGPPRRRQKPIAESQVHIAVGEPIIHGPISMEAVRRVVHANRDQIRYCYSQALTLRPTLAGKLVLAFVIEESGYVGTARVARSDLGDAGLEVCVRDKVRTWRFPMPPDGGQVTVSYPFVFQRPR